MIPQFNNSLLNSIFLWAENRTLDKGQSYINLTTKLYYTPDPSIETGYVAYNAPFRQWVYDSGVQGARIIDSISGSAGIIERGQSGIKFDYENGRVLFPGSFGKKMNITGSYSFKEINFYQANEDVTNILYQYSANRFTRNPDYNTVSYSGLEPYVKVCPAVFITKTEGRNTPFELGGMQDSKRTFSLLIIGDTSYQVNNFHSLMEDATNKSFPLLSIYDDPITEIGDIKSGYNYKLLCNERGTPGNLAYIESVRTSNLSDTSKGPSSNFIGFCNIQVSFPRMVD